MRMASLLNGYLKSPAPRRSLYFVNGVTDFLFIGGFSMVAFGGLGLFDGRGGSASIYAVLGMLSWGGNWPHFVASTGRLSESPDNIRQYPVQPLGVPLV